MNYFKNFGKIKKVKLIYNPKTGLCKGYGFVICSNSMVYRRILAKKKHTVDGRVIDCNFACKKSEAPDRIKNVKKRKLFVGGITHDTTNGNFLLKYFF